MSDPQRSSEPAPAPRPRGLVLFAAGTPRRLVRAKLAFAGLAAAAGACLMWPVYPLFSGIRPLILGLPLSLAWVVLWLLVVFIGLLVLYRVEHGRAAGHSGGSRAPATARTGREEAG